MNFPTSLDTLLNPGSTTAMDAVGYEHHTAHANLNDAVAALQAKVGIDNSLVTTSFDYRIRALEAGGGGGAVAESAVTFTDITTNNVSITKHGYVPKAPNDTAKFLRGDATWAVITAANVTNALDLSTTRSANLVLAGPATGSAAAPTFRALVAGDIPGLSSVYLALAGGTMTGDIAIGTHQITSLQNASAGLLPQTKLAVVNYTTSLSHEGGSIRYGTTTALSGLSHSDICGWALVGSSNSTVQNTLAVFSGFGSVEFPGANVSFDNDGTCSFVGGDAGIDPGGTIWCVGIQITAGATDGYVLTSDSSGNATWQAAAGGGGSIAPLVVSSNLVEQINGTTAQQFNIYKTFTDGSNYRRGSLYFSGSDFYVSANGLGTGAGSGNLVLEASGTHSIRFRINSTDLWNLNDSGQFAPFPANDNLFDLGGSDRQIRNGYFGTKVITPALQVTTGAASGSLLTSDGSGNATWGKDYDAANYSGGTPSFTPTSGKGYAIDTSNGAWWIYYSAAWHNTGISA